MSYPAWDSKEALLESADLGQYITDFSILRLLIRSNERDQKLFSDLGEVRKARICQLKAEMFAARARELSMPQCSVCGNSHELKGEVCAPCWWWNWRVTLWLKKNLSFKEIF